MKIWPQKNPRAAGFGTYLMLIKTVQIRPVYGKLATSHFCAQTYNMTLRGTEPAN
jgi:hypothetical protein